MAVSARQTTAAPLATESVYVAVPAPTDISDQLRRGLNVLRKVAGFVSAAVTRRDGLVIFHTFRSAREAAALSAMAAAMAGAARSTGTELGQGLPESCVIRYESGVLLIQEAGPEAVLACLMEPESNVGFALMKTTQVADDIRAILEEF